MAKPSFREASVGTTIGPLFPVVGRLSSQLGDCTTATHRRTTQVFAGNSCRNAVGLSNRPPKPRQYDGSDPEPKEVNSSKNVGLVDCTVIVVVFHIANGIFYQKYMSCVVLIQIFCDALDGAPPHNGRGLSPACPQSDVLVQENERKKDPDHGRDRRGHQQEGRTWKHGGNQFSVFFLFQHLLGSGPKEVILA